MLGRPGCHLCDDARALLQRVADDLAAAGDPIRVVELSILDDPALEAELHDDIPVVLVNGTLHARWHLEDGPLRDAVASAR